MASAWHNFNCITFVTKRIIKYEFGYIVLWRELYVLGEPRVGTSRVGGLT